MCAKKLSFSTEPAAVPGITVIGSTTNLSVSWSPASGEVVSYTVLLYRDSQLEEVDRNLSNNTVNKQFLDREPGVLYCVVVVTKSGTFESNSSEVCNATCELHMHHDWKPVHTLCTIYMFCTNEIIFLLLVQFPILLVPSWWSLRVWSPSTSLGPFQITWTINSTASVCPALMAPFWLITTGSCWTVSSLEAPTTSLLLLWACWTIRAQQWQQETIPVSVINTHPITPGLYCGLAVLQNFL